MEVSTARPDIGGGPEEVRQAALSRRGNHGKCHRARGRGGAASSTLGWGHETQQLTVGPSPRTREAAARPRRRGGPRRKRGKMRASRGGYVPGGGRWAKSVKRRTTRSSGPRARVARPVAADRERWADKPRVKHNDGSSAGSSVMWSQVIVRVALAAAVALGLLVAPMAATAQSAGKVQRVGYLAGSSLTVPSRTVEAFQQGLRALGWVEGQNIGIEYRFAAGRYDRLPDLAAELVRPRWMSSWHWETPRPRQPRTLLRQSPSSW